MPWYEYQQYGVRQQFYCELGMATSRNSTLVKEKLRRTCKVAGTSWYASGKILCIFTLGLWFPIQLLVFQWVYDIPWSL